MNLTRDLGESEVYMKWTESEEKTKLDYIIRLCMLVEPFRCH